MGHGLSVIENDDVVGQSVCFFQILRRQNDGGAVANQPTQYLPKIASTARIEPGRWLIKEEHLGGRNKACGQVEPTAHTTGERFHELVTCLNQVKRFDQLIGASPSLSLGESVQPPDQFEIQSGVHKAIDGGLLGGNSDPVAHAICLPDDVEPRNGCAAFGRRRERCKNPDRRRLTCTVMAKQAKYRAGRNLHIQSTKRPQVAETLTQPFGDYSPRRVRRSFNVIHSSSNLATNPGAPEGTPSKSALLSRWVIQKPTCWPSAGGARGGPAWC